MTSSAYSVDPARPGGATVLALDTSAPRGGIALLEGGLLVKEASGPVEGRHSTWLPGAIRSLLEDAGRSLADIDVFATAVGPGSFTGVRVGVATVKGLAWPLGRKVYGASTLGAIARNFSAGTVVCPVLDARRGQVYAALYRVLPDGAQLLMDEAAFTPEELLGKVKAVCAPGPVVFAGDGIDVCAREALESLDGAALAPAELWRSTAANVARMAGWDLPGAVDPALLAPVYLRKPGAEFKKSPKNK
ncbi:MAG: tRNA (adenosine(37)-N6)-threonylcarbamoyltransferase complex dimerization subunit type 1 TsaB [Thermodesulfobacteriota bacterium]